MARELINPDTMRTPPSYSHISVASGSKIISFAGQVALNDNGLMGDDLRSQVIACMQNLKLAMDAVGVTWDDIIRRTIFTTQPDQPAVIAGAIAEVTGDAANPPQSLFGVTALANPQLLVEIECTAVID